MAGWCMDERVPPRWAIFNARPTFNSRPKAEIVYVDFLAIQISSHGQLRAQSIEEVM